MQYEFRENKNETRIFQLEETVLNYTSSQAGTEEIPYDHINKITLLSPLKDAFVCQITYDDKKKIAFANRSYKSFDHFDYQNDEYIIFLKELHTMLMNKSHIQFNAGSSFLYYFLLFSIPLIIIVPVIALLLTSLSGRRMPISPFIGLLIIIPIAIHYMKKGKKIIYTPATIPEKYLP